MSIKDIFLNAEGDAWYHRNKIFLNDGDRKASDVYKYIMQYMAEQGIEGQECKVLEVGSSYGYNLAYLNERLDITGFGIEPSQEAVHDGNKMFSKIKLIHGTSDSLPFKNEEFDVVIMGFCLYLVDRNNLFYSIAEADRVLKTGGSLIIIDFDTNIPYKRDYIHHSEVYSYKMQYEKLFLANPQYVRVSKMSFSHSDMKFNKDIQERIALHILYKDSIDNAYQRDKS